MSQIDKALDEIDWFMAKIKADKTKTTSENQGRKQFKSRYIIKLNALTMQIWLLIFLSDENAVSQSSPKTSLDKAICDRLTSIIHAFHELVQSAIPVGSNTELLLKVSLTGYFCTSHAG